MTRWTLIAIAGPLALGAPAVSQEAAPPVEEKAGGAPAEDAAGGGGLESLDDLLGIGTEERPRDVDEDLPHRSALDRALSGEEVSDEFRQAVTEMRDVADLLDAGRAGARAQRLQEDILLKLDKLIDAAQRQQQQQQQQSSSSSSSQRSPTQNQQRAQEQAQASQTNQGDNRSEMMPPGGREGALNEMLQSESAAWGNLPQRVRDALLQGSSDRFSSLYEAMTEAYFRRIAEETTER